MAQVLTFRLPETVTFRHSFFAKFPDAQFRLDRDGVVPVISFEMGDQQVLLPFSGIKREFGVSEYAADGIMLNTVARALGFVSILQIGDPLPGEILTGQSSWTFEPEHLAIAQQRITAELVGWNLSVEVPRNDPVRLRQFVAQYVNEETIGYALLRLAAHFGYAADGVSRLSNTMEEIAHELAYIEALRERCQAVGGLANKLRRLREDFKAHANVVSELEPVARLIKEPVRLFREKLAEVDSRLGEVVTLFGDFPSMRELLRDARDQLLQRLAPWGAITREWDRIATLGTDPFAIIPSLRELYRFLAPRFMPVDEWTLLLSANGPAGNAANQGSVVTWFEREPSVA